MIAYIMLMIWIGMATKSVSNIIELIGQKFPRIKCYFLI